MLIFPKVLKFIQPICIKWLKFRVFQTGRGGPDPILAGASKRFPTPVVGIKVWKLNNVMPDFVKNSDKLSLLYTVLVDKPFIIGFLFCFFVYSDLKKFTNESLHQQAQTIAELQSLNQ